MTFYIRLTWNEHDYIIKTCSDGEPIPEKDAFVTITTQLTTRVNKLFTETFKPKLDKLVAENDCVSTVYDAEVAKFIERAKKIPAGPSSVRRFRCWLAERLANEILQEDSTEESGINEKLQYYHEIKRKRGMSGKPSRNTPSGHFYPTFALQCHAENVKDETIQIWAVAFEPDVIRNGETTSLFASCGGDSVCFINAKTGKVRSKFVDPEEEFFCCSWSALTYTAGSMVSQAGCHLD